jgi:hypothetical protein
MPELLINALDSLTNWTADTGLTLELQYFEEYIANYHSSAIAIRIPSGSSGKTATLTLPAAIDVSAYKELVINVVSLRKETGQIERDSDAYYALSFATAQDFSIPTYKQLTDVSIPIDGFSSVTKLKIVINHNDIDYLILSDFRAVKESLPADILIGVKTGIERERERIGINRVIGTITASSGERVAIISDDWSFLERNMVLLFNGETHQVDNIQDNQISFLSTYDGNTLLSNATNAIVSITSPVEVGYYNRDATLPGIVVWYASPTPATRNSRAETRNECVGPLGTYQKRDGLIQTWKVQLEIVARSPELQADAARAARAFIGTSTVWVNGRKAWFEWTDPAVDNEPVEDFDIIPRASYTFDVEVREDTWQLIRMNRGNPILTVLPLTQ